LSYISQKEKKELAPAIKEVLKTYKINGTIAIRNNSTLVVNLKKGKLDLIGAAQKINTERANRQGLPVTHIDNYFQANAYREPTEYENFAPIIGRFYSDLIKAMKGTLWFDKSDIMTDYFHTAYFLSINVGKYSAPYQFIGA
tara:strand:+ start:169 stop:594 length:426 start_codon:yes stop_codon:yes gene_type:complete